MPNPTPASFPRVTLPFPRPPSAEYYCDLNSVPASATPPTHHVPPTSTRFHPILPPHPSPVSLFLFSHPESLTPRKRRCYCPLPTNTLPPSNRLLPLTGDSESVRCSRSCEPVQGLPAAEQSSARPIRLGRRMITLSLPDPRPFSSPNPSLSAAATALLSSHILTWCTPPCLAPAL